MPLPPPSSMQPSNSTMEISIISTQRRGISVVQPKTKLSEGRSPHPQTFQTTTPKPNYMLTKADQKGDKGKRPQTT
ncbi:hypothetical protein DEO72_LG10g1368 [Vigna unguiculata]|uniref:Uncharacterized protein n=1 Tax=Vigna unguiculata TaxID=3917 RepID=A0A4D6NB93_VIGUN|nr:hypothetical protein DEO72_LG10g1368 [Vigna unguiculata]